MRDMSALIWLEEDSGSEIIHQCLLVHLTQWYLEKSQMLAYWHKNLDFGPVTVVLETFCTMRFITWDQDISFPPFHCCSARMSTGGPLYIMTHFFWSSWGRRMLNAWHLWSVVLAFWASAGIFLPAVNNTMEERSFSVSGFHSNCRLSCDP